MRKYLLLVVAFIVMTALLYAAVYAEEVYRLDDCRISGNIYEIEVDFSDYYYPCPKWEDMADKVEITGYGKVYKESMEFFVNDFLCNEYKGKGFMITSVDARSCGGNKKEPVIKQAKK